MEDAAVEFTFNKIHAFDVADGNVAQPVDRGIKLVVQIVVITWTALAIYFSNLPWPALRLGPSVAFAAFAIWAFWLSRRRRMPAVAIALVLGVVPGGSPLLPRAIGTGVRRLLSCRGRSSKAIMCA